jgi:hypothetical protein
VVERWQRILLTAALLAATEQSEAWRDPESWRALRIGMSRYEVLRILGEPGKVTRYYAFERWEYPDALGRRLNFDERGRLSVWGALAR